MKPLSLIVIVFATACNSVPADKANILKSDTIIKHDTVYISSNLDWQKDFGLSHDPDRDSIWTKPVSYYINNKSCSPIAVDFYYGQFRPSDNNTTEALLKLVITDDSVLRPFYRWCLDKTIQIQDGALSEYTGMPARQYAEKFPEDFFNYLDSDTTGKRNEEWIGSISYSGYYDNEYNEKPELVRRRLIITMKQNCKNCDQKINERIEKFGNACFDLDLN